jgi:adenosylhomocysteine nucleosidase
LNAAGVVAALAAEARALSPTVSRDAPYTALGDGTLVTVSGIGSSAARIAAQRLIDAGAGALVSWGMAGGLDPALAAGAVCLPREVIAADGSRYPTAPVWRESLAGLIAAQRAVTGGSLLTASQPIESVAAKNRAFLETGAAVVDMESSAVAAAAKSRDLPFVAVRVVVDTASDTVPACVAASSGSGRVRTGQLLLGLMRSPGEILPLARLARRYRSAIRSLEAVARIATLVPPAGGARAVAGVP